ncbi:MAG TPA: nuclear transport factor 2 family protein [Parafilimonas sp.]|nr:nuclear transport factor 2 family protein [Parafilimonas sp.]
MKKLFCILLICLTSCKNSLDKNVEDAMQQYDDYILHVDAKGIASMFTPDGELTEPGGMSVLGRDSIEKFLSQFSGIKVEKQKSTTDSIRRFGDTAFQYGKYYQRAVVNNTEAEVNGAFQANWLIEPDGKLMLKRMSAWPVSNK